MGKICSVLSAAIVAATLAAAAYAQQPDTQPAGKWTIVVHGGAGSIERSKLTPAGDAAYRASLTQATKAGRQGAGPGRLGAGCGGGRDPGSRRRSALQCGPRRGLYLRGQKRAGRVHHGRLQSEGRRGGRGHAHAPSHQPGARGDGEVALRDADRRGRRRLCRAGLAWSRWTPASFSPRRAGSRW